MMLTKEDLLDLDFAPDYTGMVMAMDVKCLKEEFRNEKYQIVICSGFGCNPHMTSKSTFVEWLDGDAAKYSRDEILGCPKQNSLKNWYALHKDEIHNDSFRRNVEKQMTISDNDMIKLLKPKCDHEENKETK